MEGLTKLVAYRCLIIAVFPSYTVWPRCAKPAASGQHAARDMVLCCQLRHMKWEESSNISLTKAR